MPRRNKTGFPVSIDVYIGVEEEGAIGDGVADDTAAFQAAIDKLPAAGGIIQVQEGDFSVTGASLSVGVKEVFWLLNGQVNTSYSPSSWPGTIINGNSISSGSITTAMLADNSVTGAKIAMGSDAQGDVLYYDGTDYARLGVGTSGQVLTTGGAGADPSWTTLSGSEPSDADKGDITVSSSGTVWTIDAGAISTAKIADNAVDLDKLEHGTTGDILYYGASGEPFRLAKGSDDEVLTLASGLPSWAALTSTSSGFATALYHIQDQKASGVASGSFTTGGWRTRTFNTELTAEITGASLSTNQITLEAGTYWLEARAPALSVDGHKVKIYNITDTADILIGASGSTAPVGAGTTTDATVSGRFTLGGTKVIELQHRCVSTKAANGFGAASGLSVVEVYAEIKIWKIG